MINQRKGFTLVELLVVLFIIVLLVAIGLPKIRNYGKRNGLRTAAQEIKSQILYAQALARTPDRKGATKYAFAVNFSEINYCLYKNGAPDYCPNDPADLANVIAQIPKNYMIIYTSGDTNTGVENSVVKAPSLLPSSTTRYDNFSSCPDDNFFIIDFNIPSGKIKAPSSSCPLNIEVLPIKYSGDSNSDPVYGYANININYISGEVGIEYIQ